MAVILIVDDRPTNRDFLITLLGYRGHRLLEAADGAEALQVARAVRPDLIVSDILMPTMDGYEFVRRLRTDTDLAQTPVIFSTAHYLNHEAKALARQCGVSFVLPKPCEPDVVLGTVDAALGLAPMPGAPPQEEVFDREHLRLLTNQLAHKAEELHAVNQKLEALLELGQHLVSECDPQHLLEAYCRGAREIIGAKWAAVRLVNEDEATGHQLFVSGLDRGTIALVGPLQANQGMLGDIFVEHRPYRLQIVNGEPHLASLSPQFPRVSSLLGVPIMHQARVYGWLCLANKLGDNEFSDIDERLAVNLAAQMAIAYKNTRLFARMRRQATELTVEVVERAQTELALEEQVTLAALSAEVSVALTHNSSLQEMLRQCTEIIGRHLDAAFACIWTLNVQENVLELQASAGMYTHRDGPHSRLPVGQFKIGLIAQERQPHLTNAVIGDPRVHDQEWAQREGMVAFAGSPSWSGSDWWG